MESVLLRVFLAVLVSDSFLWAIPIIPEDANQTETSGKNLNGTNGTAHNLYIIRTIIYEVGILTDADNDTDSSNETHEQVDLTFYDPERNSSAIDLSNIPFPVQTNVSEQIITGIAPANFGILTLPSPGLKENGSKISGHFHLNAPVFPDVVLSQMNNVSTTDLEEEERIIEGLPEELGI